jgi:hypothetical protein
LMQILHSHDSLKPLLNRMTAQTLANALITLSKQEASGVELKNNTGRVFSINRGIANAD